MIVALAGLFSYLSLWFILRGDLFKPCLVLFVLFCVAITSLGEERANLSVFHTYARVALVWFCLFPLSLGVWEGLRLVSKVNSFLLLL